MDASDLNEWIETKELADSLKFEIVTYKVIGANILKIKGLRHEFKTVREVYIYLMGFRDGRF